jgi:hypothetical protein
MQHETLRLAKNQAIQMSDDSEYVNNKQLISSIVVYLINEISGRAILNALLGHLAKG